METSKLPVGPRPPESFDPKTCVGGTGSTGGTGNIGGNGSSTQTLSLVKNKPTSVAELAEQVRNERIVMFTGMTGAPGQAGEIKVNEQGELVAPVSDEAEEKLNQSLLTKIESMGLDELAGVVVDNNIAIGKAIASVDASNGIRGYTSGKALLRAEYLSSSSNLKKGFEDWRKANLNHHRISLRTCQKHMDIARTPDVLGWLVLGIEKLAALKPILNSIEDLDKHHPITDFMERFEVDPTQHTDVEDLRFEIGVAMAMAKLKKNEVVVPRKLVQDFLEKGFDLTLKDIEVMKEAQDAGGEPGKYLEKLIANGQRPKASKSKEITVDNIHEQAQLLNDAVGKLLKAPRIKGDIEVDRITTLIKTLEALKARIAPAPVSN